MKTLLLLIAIAAFINAQTAAPVSLSQAPAPGGLTTVTHYTASGNPDYICKAASTQDPTRITVSAITNANPGVMTATAHGLFFQSGVSAPKAVVFVSGLSGNWTPLNGMHVVTPASANSLTTDVDSTTFGAVTGTIVVSTRAPKVTSAYWSLQAIAYDTNGNPVYSGWVAPTTGTILPQLRGGQNAFSFACAAPGSFE